MTRGEQDFDRALSKIDPEECVRFLQKVIHVPGTLGKERELAESLAAEMKEIGFESQLMIFDEERGNAFGRLRGDGTGRSLMLQAHLDGPLLIDGWTVDPYGGLVKDGAIYGLGVRDVKAGIAACILAMKAVMDAGIELKGDVVYAGVAGHQDHAIGVEKMLESGIRTDLCIISEPTDNRIMVANRGWSYVDITTHGKNAWTPKRAEGINAITKMSKLILGCLDEISFKPIDLPEDAREFFPEPVAYTNIGLISGGIRGNQVADLCKITMDVRTALGKEDSILDEIREKVRAMKEDEDPEIDATVDFSPGFPIPSFFISPKDPLVRLVTRSFETVYKRVPKYFGGMGTTDAGKMQKAGIPTVIYGPGHQPYTVTDENYPVDGFLMAVKVYTHAILEVCTRDRSEMV